MPDDSNPKHFLPTVSPALYTQLISRIEYLTVAATLWKDFVRRSWETIHPTVELLFPPQCLLCNHNDQLPADRIPLCLVCREEFLSNRPKLCRRCAMPVPDSLGDNVTQCADCHGRRLFFQQAEVLQLYRGLCRTMVLKFKEPAHETLAVAAGNWLGDQLFSLGWAEEIDVVTSIPVHWLRRFVRGYHAAETLATAVAERLQRPAVTDLLYCRRWTAKQSSLLLDERHANMRRALAVAPHYAVKGCRVLVVDDVITTGATATAAARALKQAGATDVRIAAIARGTGEA